MRNTECKQLLSVCKKTPVVFMSLMSMLICRFSLFYITVNGISLDFGLLAEQTNQFEDATIIITGYFMF